MSMIYPNIREGIFIARLNRFVAEVDLGGKVERCHVKNTGRCRELFIPGATVYVNQPGTPGRATKYDLIAVYKGDRLVNVDSQAPNKVFLEYLRSGSYMSGITRVQPEAAVGGSRLDFCVEHGRQKAFIEVKGVTLEQDGVALFPDAPTLRGVKHLHELAACVRAGHQAQVVFVIQMRGVRHFTPNNKTHPAFGAALAAAEAAGVKVTALDCDVRPDRLAIRDLVPVKL